MNPAELSPVAVVGPGRVGRALAVALHELGLDVTLGMRTTARGLPAGEDARLVGVARSAAEPAVAGARCVLLTVRDDELPGLVDALAGAGAFRQGQLVVHPAGVYGTAVLAPAAAARAGVAACHPAQTFTDDLTATLGRLPGTAWGVTADPASELSARTLVQALGGVPFEVPEAARPAYHAAIVLAANGAAALTAAAADVLRGAGIADPALVLAGLVHASVDSALAHGEAGLSGPWVRGDGRTVALHVAALAGQPAVGAAHAAVARLVAERARTTGRLDEAARDRLVAALESRLDAAEQPRLAPTGAEPPRQGG